MSKFSAIQEFGAALVKLTPMLLITVLAACASKGERASALDQSSSGGRGYNASAAHAPGANGQTADAGGQSSTQAGGNSKRKEAWPWRGRSARWAGDERFLGRRYR
jgi:hypothetical protein